MVTSFKILLVVVTTAIKVCCCPSVAAAKSSFAFDREVQARVTERIDDLLQPPIDAAGLTESFRRFGGFPNALRAADRDLVQKHYYSQVETLGLKVYHALEDGSFVSQNDDHVMTTYREPGQSGFVVTATNIGTTTEVVVEPSYMEKYYYACVNATNGEAKTCDMEPNAKYIECPNDDCDSQHLPCADDASQQIYNKCVEIYNIKDDSVSSSDLSAEAKTCLADKALKWCRVYTVRQTPDEVSNSTATVDEETKEKTTTTVIHGFVPRTSSCIGVDGLPSQTPGKVLVAHPKDPYLNPPPEEPVLGVCTFQDGVSTTTTTREIKGKFAYCGANETSAGSILQEPYNTCSGTFTGAFESSDYDPRYRGWFMATKQNQRALWTDPYVFFISSKMGITYSVPFYSKDPTSGRMVFDGAIAIDYRLDSISSFLKNEYQGTATLVAVVETVEPYYLLGVSTGTDPARKVLVGSNELCPDDDKNAECETSRVSMDQLGVDNDNRMDRIVRRAFNVHRKADFPHEALLSVKETDEIGSDAFLSQATIYEKPETGLKWRIIVISPMDRSSSDTISVDSENSIHVIIVCLIGVLGFGLCTALLVIFYSKRKEQAVIHADWRFTLAFIAGCAILNLTTLTSLGENTNDLCLLRMWFFNSFFAIALSPLLVKVWRMHQLLENSARMTRKTITNGTAALYTLPLILAQLLILTIFTFIDPPRQSESIETTGFVATQHVTCERDSIAFFAVQLTFDALIVLVGCALAFQTRNLDPKFGEAKQLIFALYNIAFTGIIILVISTVVDIEQNSKYILHAIGIFWASLFSSCAFVLPRLIEVHESRRESFMSRSNRTRVSGLDLTGPPSIYQATSEAPDETSMPMRPEERLRQNLSLTRRSEENTNEDIKKEDQLKTDDMVSLSDHGDGSKSDV